VGRHPERVAPIYRVVGYAILGGAALIAIGVVFFVGQAQLD
jgi:hypothetical protein